MSETFRVSDQTIETAATAYVMAGGFSESGNRLGVDGSAMRAALVAALPSLVAEIRGQIASEIEASNPMEGKYAPQWHRGLRWALEQIRGGVL